MIEFNSVASAIEARASLDEFIIFNGGVKLNVCHSTLKTLSH